MKNKKNLIIPVVLGLLAIILLISYVLIELRKSGTIGSLDSKSVLAEFYEYYESKEKTIIYYAAPNCQYCTLQTPILETIAEDYDLDYYYLDSSKLSASQREEVLEKLGMDEHATPTTAIVKNGKVVDKKIGYVQGNKYVEFFIKNGILEEDAVYSEEAYITFIEYDEYEDLIDNKETSIIVIGQTSCGHCTAIRPALNTVAKNYDLTINYLNLTDLNDDERSSFYESLNELGYDDPDYVEKGSFGTPLTIIVRNSKIRNYISGSRTTSQLVRELSKIGVIEE